MSRPIPKATEGAVGKDLEKSSSDFLREIFDKAVDTFGKASVVATLLGCSNGAVSEMRNGGRSISSDSLKAIWRACRKDADWAFAWASAEAQVIGFVRPMRVRRAVRRDVERLATARVRRITPLWRGMRRDLAADLGTTEDDVDAALDGEE